MRAITVALCVGLAFGAAACSNDSNSGSPDSSTAAPTTTQGQAQLPQMDLSSFGQLPAARPLEGATIDCIYNADVQAVKPVEKPTASAVPTNGTVNVAMVTNQGPIGLTLNRAEAPCAVNSFENLVRQGYYNDSPCHRLSTSGLLILQCGDPSGTGRGGPGYAYANEYPTTAYEADDPAAQDPIVYPRGTIAMANTGQPSSNGSQFFLVYDDSPLPPQYTVFGTISDEGLSTIAKIAAGGDDGSMSAGGGKPKTPVQIETAAVA